MSLREMTCVVVECDGCGELFQDGLHFEDRADAEAELEVAAVDEWQRWDQGSDGTLECPSCRDPQGTARLRADREASELAALGRDKGVQL